MSHKFKNLVVWQKSKEMVVFIYNITSQFPTKELYGLTSQTNRAAVSVLANIAEGSSRRSKKDFYRFLEIALGSAFELESLIIIAYEMEYLAQEQKKLFENYISEIEKLLNGLMRSLYE